MMIGGIRQRLLGLCLPPLLFCILDCTATLVGQPSNYWAGDYSQANEESPVFNHLLHYHPAAFAAGIMVWSAVFVAILLLLPDTLALIVSIAVTFGHTVGLSTWLLWHFRYGYQAVNGLFLTSAVILGLCIRWGWQVEPAHQYRLTNWPGGLRWVVIAGLFAIGVYLFLWPHKV